VLFVSFPVQIKKIEPNRTNPNLSEPEKSFWAARGSSVSISVHPWFKKVQEIFVPDEPNRFFASYI